MFAQSAAGSGRHTLWCQRRRDPRLRRISFPFTKKRKHTKKCFLKDELSFRGNARATPPTLCWSPHISKAAPRACWVKGPWLHKGLRLYELSQKRVQPSEERGAACALQRLQQNAVMGAQQELQETTPRPEESEIIRRCERETTNVITFKLSSL